MSPRRHFLSPIVLAVVIVLAAAHSSATQQLTLTPYKASGIYGVGEKVGWTANLSPASAPTGDYTYTIKKNNQDVIKTGKLDLATVHATIEVALNEPAMVYIQISTPGGSGPGSSGSIAVGAAVAPEKLLPSVPRPVDFDSFWDSKIRMLKAIPENTVLTSSDSGRPDIEYATIRMDHINGTHVYGQLAKPKRDGKLPALVIL